ncbi:MAG: hypothetical protein H7177_12600 [Rhizobacter sp.]|nr:hypothetical protein [Bacteriovorax sp.]
MLNLSITIISFYILERLLELVVSTSNKRILKKDMELKILNPVESRQMKIFHGLWFCLLFLEAYMWGHLREGFILYIIILILVLAQILRWSAIFTLGKYWSVDVYEMKEHMIINKGPYVYLKHPNYLAVILEFFFLPLLLGCPVILILGSLGNALILRRRINMEERALNQQSNDYGKKFMGKHAFIFLK